MKVIYKSIGDDYPDYMVGNDGSVVKITSSGEKKQVAQSKSGHGYLAVKIYDRNRKRKAFRVARLVAIKFIVNPLKKPEVNHKNGIKIDNRVSNLEWCTRSENMQHAMHNGLEKSRKLTQEQVRDVRMLYSTSVYSQSKLAKIFGVSQSTIGDMINRKTYALVK